MFAIRRNKDNLLLSCCGFVYINWVHRHADLSLYIGWKDSCSDDLGYAEESCKQRIEYGFSELSLNKIWMEIYEFDDKKKNFTNAWALRWTACFVKNTGTKDVGGTRSYCHYLATSGAGLPTTAVMLK